MRIAIPVTSDHADARIADTFARAPFFLITDSQTGAEQIIANPSASESNGAGVKAAQTIVDQGVSVLLAPRCGQSASQVLEAASVTISKVPVGPAHSVAANYLRGKLGAEPQDALALQDEAELL
jgi:predicted Fe-Mo cluster-binding NifX family protein